MRPKPAFKRSRWAPGMFYAVPLVDGTFSYVQAISEASPNVIDIAVFNTRSPILESTPPTVQRGQVIALLATWRQDLNNGNWAALGVAALVIQPSEMPNQAIIASGTTVGVKHSDAGLITRLLNAWHGLVPWNVMFDENYFDAQLAPGITRPPSALVLTPAQREAFRAGRATNGA